MAFFKRKAKEPQHDKGKILCIQNALRNGMPTDASYVSGATKDEINYAAATL